MVSDKFPVQWCFVVYSKIYHLSKVYHSAPGFVVKNNSLWYIFLYTSQHHCITNHVFFLFLYFLYYFLFVGFSDLKGCFLRFFHQFFLFQFFNPFWCFVFLIFCNYLLMSSDEFLLCCFQFPILGCFFCSPFC